MLLVFQVDGGHHHTSNSLSLITHASLLAFYVAVHVWGALVIIELAKKKVLHYSYSPIKVVMFATIQNLVSI